jgi:hypothetical protein
MELRFYFHGTSQTWFGKASESEKKISLASLLEHFINVLSKIL